MSEVALTAYIQKPETTAPAAEATTETPKVEKAPVKEAIVKLNGGNVSEVRRGEEEIVKPSESRSQPQFTHVDDTGVAD